jgi:hypothetical protein
MKGLSLAIQDLYGLILWKRTGQKPSKKIWKNIFGEIYRDKDCYS